MARTFPSLQKVLLDRFHVDKFFRFLFETFESWNIRNPNVWRYVNLLLWVSKYLVKLFMVFQGVSTQIQKELKQFFKIFWVDYETKVLFDFIFPPRTVCVDTKTTIITKLKTFSREGHPMNSKWTNSCDWYR